MNMKGAKDIGVKKVMRYAQATQHSGKYAATAKGHHVYSSRTDLYALKRFCGETSATMWQSL